MNPATQKIMNAVSWPRPLPATILLVEDEAAVREVTREALEMAGYRVLEAGGPEAAMRIVSDPSAEIDLLLTDVVMPGMSGPELARHVSATRPGLVTIFMSGYAESETLRAAVQGLRGSTFRNRLRLTACWRKWLKRWRRDGAAQTGTRLRSSPPRSVSSARPRLPMDRQRFAGSRGRPSLTTAAGGRLSSRHATLVASESILLKVLCDASGLP